VLKRRCILILAGLFLSAVGVIWWCLPRPVVEQDFEVHLIRVGETLTEITDEVDTNALVALLQEQEHGRFSRRRSVFHLTESSVEITGRDHRDVWHIALDEEYQVVYVGEKKYPIKNGDMLLQAVWEIIHTS